MLVYTEIFSQDEVMSDAYRAEAPFGDESLFGSAFEVQSTRQVKKDDDCGVACNVDEDAEEGAVADVSESEQTVIDVIERFGLVENEMSKADFLTYIKSYMRNIKTHLEANKPDRVAPFIAAAGNLVKRIKDNYGDFQIFMGQNYCDYWGEYQSMPIVAYYPEGSLAPRFVFWRDGLKEVKC